MRKFQIVLAAVGFALAAGTPSRAASCADQNTYFPLTPGAVWTYKVMIVDNGDTQVVRTTQRFAATAAQGAPIAGELKQTMGLPGFSMTMRAPVRVVKRAVYFGAQQMEATGPEGFAEKAVVGASGFELYLPDIKNLNDKWLQTGTFEATASLGPAQAQLRGTVSEANWARARGFERVTVPAGTFLAMKVDITVSGTLEGAGAASVRMTDWFAPGVGLVKEASADGTYVSELTSYDVAPCCNFTVASAEGNVSVDGKPAEPGMRFSGSSSVKVAGGGRMSLAMGDGSMVQVNGDAQFSLQTFCTGMDEAHQASHTVVGIVRGKLLFLIGKIFSRGSFEVHTPACVDGPRGTEFSEEVVNENGRWITRIEVVRGSVWVRKKGETKEIILHAGEKGRF